MVAVARRLAFEILRKTEKGGYASDLLLAACEGIRLARCRPGVRDRIRVPTPSSSTGLVDRSGTKRDPREDGCGGSRGAADGVVPASTPGPRSTARDLNESVDLVKSAKKASASGLVNAVLRRAPRQAVEWPSRGRSPCRCRSGCSGMGRAVRPAAANGSPEAFLEPPETFVRNPPAGDGSGPGSRRESRVHFGVSRAILPDFAFRTSVRNRSYRCSTSRRGRHFWTCARRLGTRRLRHWSPASSAVACDLHWRRLQTVTGCARVVLDANEGSRSGRDSIASWWMRHVPVPGLWGAIPRSAGGCDLAISRNYMRSRCAS